MIPGDIRPYPLVLPANQIYSYIMSEDAIANHNTTLYARRDVVEPSTGLEPQHATVDGQEGEWVTEEQTKYHKVRRNETMASIAKKYGVTLRSLKRANGNISKPRRGQTLKVITSVREFRPYKNQPQPQPDDNLLVKNPETETQPNDSIAADASNPAAQADSIAPAQEGDTPLTEHETADIEAETSEPQSATSVKVGNSFQSSKAKQEASRKHKKKNDTNSRKANNNKTKTYTVRKGDSLYKIAKAHGMTVKELQNLNNLRNDKLDIGDKLKVK